MSVRVMSWVWENSTPDWSVFSSDHYRPPRQGRLPRYAYRHPDWERANIHDVAQRDGWTCAYCGCDVENKGNWDDDTAKPEATVDHVVPQRRGGGDTNYNAVLACPSCNSSKGARHPALMFA